MAMENEADFASQGWHFVNGDSNHKHAEHSEHEGQYYQDSSEKVPEGDEAKNGSKL
jgi:hypothetical protein